MWVDRVVLGAGVFGLRAADLLLAAGETVALVDLERRPVVRASLINQARVHNGYHYPRSVYTAVQSARYYDRFVADFPQAVNRRFRAIYAVAAEGTYVDATHFERFCERVGAPARRIDESALFRPGAVEAAYETNECGFDAPRLRAALESRLTPHASRLRWFLDNEVHRAEPDGDHWRLWLRSGPVLTTAGVVNCTYAGTNGVLTTFGLDPLPLKYELCEVALVDAPAHARTGVTVLDGPFFSLMPFGHAGLHSLTAVDYTPHTTSTDVLPTFPCQREHPSCRPAALDNCGVCRARPASSYAFMQSLADRFVRDGARIRKVESLFCVKTVLRTSEVDDSRPTLVKVESLRPSFITLFSGKINTLYDLDGAL
jgi:glycine/D-amino acid oxidase-like deaminating enzyme